MVVTDAWKPQVNGVVRTMTTVIGELEAMGHTVEVAGPDRFRTIPCPTYPDIRLSLFPGRALARMIESFRPDALHVSTEGPLGLAARAWARRHSAAFTTAFHTRFAEYIHARTGIPISPIYAWMRWFHGAGSGMMVATQSLREDLAARGFRHIRPWTRGVDLALFQPYERSDFLDLPRPVFVYIGRVAVEKNIGAFLDLDLPGSKVVVGGGPQLDALRKAYPAVVFTGPRFGEPLARSYASADVFVFPSVTDTFGLVLLEALACGTPVAAYPVTGPRDVLAGTAGMVGAVDADLRNAALMALNGDRAACRIHAETYSWRACAETFVSHLVPLGMRWPS
ncbi:glycosyltransferase family 4 protein [Rhodopila sp.]|uniref:glycosyltransferase family 4 protein n=1 Tax=Rhodopila sp. TaxID=2480087 RepID=UPI002C9F1CF2|nr:glycosyltransferase family 1 protein [Rhodopila sp.]HVZ06396.1 glycosyltransferase family 1 protein [Rhodopila sp.]